MSRLQARGRLIYWLNCSIGRCRSGCGTQEVAKHADLEQIHRFSRLQSKSCILAAWMSRVTTSFALLAQLHFYMLSLATHRLDVRFVFQRPSFIVQRCVALLPTASIRTDTEEYFLRPFQQFSARTRSPKDHNVTKTWRVQLPSSYQMTLYGEHHKDLPICLRNFFTEGFLVTLWMRMTLCPTGNDVAP